ncbi:uncharacterized protein K02A2.6-like [Galendromus occidentalis]|uniref:RNA-directed DNA polymerase n=1 Tax=Galendromus occidentalis TaxID=34638 RepID=A0AAJ6QLZ4_9ACAR|nr:uncharacterized protein K02A2.6-like [Galendromus occidentalis]
MEEVIAALELLETEVHGLIAARREFTPTGAAFKDATARDPILKEVLQRLLRGWKKTDFRDSFLRVFAQKADSLCDVQGIPLYDDRVIIPTALRAPVLRKLHQAHPGIVRMKALARAHFCWPGITSDVVEVVKSCAYCAKQTAKPVKVPLAPWPDPEKPWVRLHLDFAEPQEDNAFLVIVDAFSRYVDATFMSPATSSELVKYLRVVFRHFGRPETILSDDGAQFTSSDFAQLCQDFDAVHLRSPVYSPQSKGCAEKMVSTLKSSLERANSRALDEAVVAYNYTPNAALDGKTPAEVFSKRILRSPFSVFRSQQSRLSEKSEKF